MWFPRYSLLVLAAVPVLCASLTAQQQTPTAGLSAVVPRLVNFSSRALDPQGNAVSGTAGVTFSIYKEQYEGTPLWLETQNVQADAEGNYSVQLGATSAGGLPLDLFVSGEARWLGVRVNGGPEPTRVLLLSVPYALKAADAETLGGLPVSAFVLATPVHNAGASPTTADIALTSPFVAPPASSDVTTTGGTVNSLPLFTTATNVQSSAITQNGSGATAKIGIGTTAPAATLDIHGTTAVRGTLMIPATGAATAAAGKPSEPINITASSFNSGTAAAVGQTFQLKAEQANNNTAAPGATLNLLYGLGSATPAETGLKIGPKGIIAFAPGQTFPGISGTVTSVGLSAPSSDFTVSGSPVTGSGTLNFAWVVAPTNADTANAIVKRDTNGAFSSGAIFAVSHTDNGVYGFSDSGGYGVVGSTNTSTYGVYGTSTTFAGVGGAVTTSGDGVQGYSPLGRGVYGEAKSGQGVMGESFGTATTANGFGPDGVVGISHDSGGYGVNGVNYGQAGIGVYGSGGGIGVYGASVSGVGVVGTSDTGYAFVAGGNVEQERASGGWVKAMAYVDGWTTPYTIVRCFNSYLNGSAATTPPCGFTLQELSTSDFSVDFGFEVNDRFYSMTLDSFDTDCICNPVPLATPYSTTKLNLGVLDSPMARYISARFHIIVY
jgi:hypothetical protein